MEKGLKMSVEFSAYGILHETFVQYLIGNESFVHS